MRVARTIGSGATTGAGSEVGGRRRGLLRIAAAASVLGASTLVNVLVASHASAASTELYSWGYNVDGQLGNGTTTNATTPVKVSLPSGVTATAAAAGENHSLAVGSDGKLYAWGNNTYGQLGNGTTNSSSTPVVVSMPAGVTATAVAAGVEHSVALGSNGSVYTWGNNGFGQLGTGNTTSSLTPVKVTLPGGVTPKAVAAGQFMTEILDTAGDVYSWGDGEFGDLGNQKSVEENSPVQADVSAVTAIAAGGYHTLVISLGSVFAYGYNALGQLGDNTLQNKSTRVKAIMPSGVTAIAVAAGQYHSMAIGNNGKLYAWGNNGNGELGNGTTTNAKEPGLVSMPAGVTPSAITAGAEDSMAIGSDGNLYAWGYNGLGELGNGSTTDSHTPIQVGLTPVAKPPTAIASGSSADHSFAIAPPTPAPTTTTLSTSPSSVSYGQTVTITAQISRSDGGGTVSFANNSTTITGCGSVTPTLVGGLYQAQCSTSFAAGTYPLTATYSGDTLYAASTSSVLDLAVNQAPLVITASSGSTTYGSGPPAVTASYSGFVNGDSAGSLATPPTCSTTATVTSPVGNYVTSCSGASDPNYAITYQNGTMTVGTAPLAVTASSGTMTYGGTVPTISASYSGFVNGDSAGSLTTQPTCSTTATSSSPVGSYTTSCSGASDPNYQITYAQGAVAVGTAPLVITASSGSTTYGNGPPAITPSYSGFVNGDTVHSLSSPATCSTTATVTSPVGSYDTTCSGAVDPNYSITYQDGSVTVTPAPLTITASSGMMSYGGSTPSVTPLVSGLQNGETVSVLGGGLTCSTTATSSSGIGTYPTSCSGAVDANYTITYVDGTTTVNPAPLTITATSGTMTYGGAVPVISPNVSGLQNGENISVLGAGLTCTTPASPTSPVGTYPTSCSGASDLNYTVSYVSGTVVISPAPLSITASSTSMTYGDAAPTITPIISGFQNGETSTVLGAALMCGTSAGPSTSVGDYASECAGAVDANYTITYILGVVTVNPATLMITASSATVAYGSAPPTITAAYSGFVNSDDSTSLTTPPTCSTTATSSSPVGNYPSSCSGASDANYTISYLDGSVQVATVVVTVTASSAPMTYGGSVPSITPSYSGFVNDDTAASLTTAATCSTAATSASSVGSYPSSCSGAVDPNYTFSYVEGSVQVDPAPLTIAASSDSMTYGGSTPAILPLYTGFVNGDTAAGSLSTQPTCTTTATSSSPVGTYVSSCSGAVSSNYTISYVPGAVVVGSAALVISASSASMTYGGTVPTINPSYSGFVNGDTAASLTTGPTCSTTATASSPVGSYPSSCSGAVDANYTITYVAGSVTSGPAPLSITASSGSFTYGGSVPTITASYSGFVNSDTAASLTTQPTCSTTATATTPVGTYLSACSGAVDANYTITYVGGSVQVTPATLSITASSALGQYGDAVAPIAPAYLGFVAGDTAASLTTQPTCSTTATSASPVGSYPTSCAGAVDPNYSFSYVDGSLQVGPAPLVVTASSASITYGGAAPVIQASYSGFVNGEDATALTTAPTCTTSVTSVTPVGTYGSTCSGAVDPNYTFSYQDGTVQVGLAPITVTASSGSMTYGGAVPAVTAGVAGLQNGEDASVLSGLACSTAATSASAVGSYPTSCSGAVDANYSITYVSGSIVVGPAALSISASSGSMTYGGSPPTIAASYSGFVNGDIPSSLTTPPTCSTTATSSSAVGTYDSSCSGASDANYTVSYVDGSVQVMTAPLIIAASSPTMTYGSSVPTITASYSGFVNGDNAASLTTPPMCSSAATSTSPVGSYPDSCSGAVDTNYTITYVPGLTTVGTAVLVIRASSGTMTYGGSAPTITASYSGFVNGDNANSLSTKPVCSTTANGSTPVGSYTTSCSGAADSNYTISYVSGLVTVGPAPLSISASSGSMTYGGASPAITASYAGFVNGQGPSVLGGVTCTTVATATSPVGSYASSCSGAADANYNISYIPGSVTVGPATLTVTANNVTKAFGAAVPTLTATISGFVNGQTLATSGVTGQALCTTTATTTSPGGTYPITCSLGTLAAHNYAFTFVSGTLTVTFSQRTVCDYIGRLVVSGGQSVLIPPGCIVIGAINVEPGSSLDAEGAIVVGAVSFNSGVVLRFCSTTVVGAVYATLATNPVVLGDGTTSCLGDEIAGLVTVTGNTAGVSLQKAQMLAAVSVTSNSGGVTVTNNQAIALVAVQNNTGGTTVKSNCILGSLTVTGNSPPVVDRPNTVIGFQTLQ